MVRRLFLPATLAVASALAAAAATPALSQLTYSGDQQPFETLDRDITAAGADAGKLADLEQRLLAALRASDATFAGRQAAAQRLGLVLAQGPAKAGADAYKPLGAMLVDDRDTDLARLALEPAPGAVIDGLFLAALGKSAGRTQLGLIDSIARRRIEAAVPALTALLQNPDTPVAGAAARALGAIASDAAVAALQAVAEPSAPAIAAAKLAAAARATPAAALPLLASLQRDARTPIHRAAAFRLSLELEAATAATRLAAVLAGNDWDLKQVAIEAIAASRAPGLVATLTGAIAGWDAPTQSAVIAAFARRNERAAIPSIVTATEHKDPTVRLDALQALGVLPGSRETALLLARFAAGNESAEAKVARQSLMRLNGPDVSAAILTGAERGDPATRAVFLEQLALRGMPEGLPTILKCRSETNPVVRAAAVAAFGELAPASEQKAVLDWTIEAVDSAEQSKALRALVNITLRNPDVAERGRAVYALIEFAQPVLALRLLPALGRIGGESSAACAARLALRDDAKVAEAATGALARWPDATALSALVVVAEKAALPDARAAALQGALRYFERSREKWTAETTGLVARLIAATADVELRRKFVALLHRANDPAALTFAESRKADDTIAAAIAIATDVIRANLAGPAKARASSMAGVSNLLDGNTTTRWTTPSLGDEWVEVDYKLTRPFARLTLDQTGRNAEFPEHYEVFVTDDPKQPGKAVASGKGKPNRTVIDFPAGTRGRYLIVRNTAERKDTPWAICELYVD